MKFTKRGHAVNGDLVTLEHPALTLAEPFASFIDVTFRGVTHQVFVAADRSAFSYANTTGEFTVGGLCGHVIEMIDTVETQATHRYQAVVDTASGALSTMSYDSVASLLSLVGALRPATTALGVVVDPDDECAYSSPPRMVLDLEMGVVEITPLTAEIIERLPAWAGTSVAAGELYGGSFVDDSPYLTLVTESCRVVVLPGPERDPDDVADTLALLRADWRR